MRWVYVFNTRLCLHKDAQASHFFSAKTSRVPLPFNSPPARVHGCSRGTSRSSTNVRWALRSWPAAHFKPCSTPNVDIFTYIHGRGCFLSLRSEAIHEQQAVEHRAVFPDTRLAALALILAVPKFYWRTRSSIVIGQDQSVSAIRQYERSATREMTATVRWSSNQRRAAKKNVVIGHTRLVRNTGGRRDWLSGFLLFRAVRKLRPDTCCFCGQTDQKSTERC